LRLIGLIGGMSWESSLEYYRLLNEVVKERLGGLHSARCVLYSVDFAEVAELQRTGRWADAARLLIEAARSLEKAGASVVLLCTNTMHKVAASIQSAIRIPLLHIADATALRIQQAGFKRVGLLGTRFTMEDDFYRGRLDTHFHLEVVLPAPGDRDLIHRIIYEELCLGRIRDDSRTALRRIMKDLGSQGAEAIILGCTELGLLVGRQDAGPPVFDTTREHALQAIDYALGKGDPR
jgi:aspartate racemase